MAGEKAAALPAASWKVVLESLEAADRIADESIASWRQLMTRLEDAWDASAGEYRDLSDLSETAFSLYLTMHETRVLIGQRLDAARAGGDQG